MYAYNYVVVESTQHGELISSRSVLGDVCSSPMVVRTPHWGVSVAGTTEKVAKMIDLALSDIVYCVRV